MKYAKAICLSSYFDEDDVEKYLNNEMKYSELKFFQKGKVYKVVVNHFDPKFFKLI